MKLETDQEQLQRINADSIEAVLLGEKVLAKMAKMKKLTSPLQASASPASLEELVKLHVQQAQALKEKELATDWGTLFYNRPLELQRIQMQEPTRYAKMVAEYARVMMI